VQVDISHVGGISEMMKIVDFLSNYVE